MRACLPALLVTALLGCSKSSPRVDEKPPARADRGRYLVHHVSLCVFCHSEVEWKKEGAPPKEGLAGGGRAPFTGSIPWLAAPNISPDRQTGAGAWSDRDFEEALRRGVGHDGRMLHPLMPYSEFHGMSDDDVASIIAYLREMPPVRKKLRPTKMPDEVEDRLMPLPYPGRVPPPDRASPDRTGAYLARIATCGQCHTPVDKQGKPVPGMEFAGGTVLDGPWGHAVASNLTPDGTGLEGLEEEAFLRLMKTGVRNGHRLSPIMPWGYYRGMTEEDLKALYAFLRTLTPVRHEVDPGTPPTPCKRCGGRHGGGEKNQ